MNRAIRDKWVAALRSGSYRQGSRVLHRLGGVGERDSFCCLGVLCCILNISAYENDRGLVVYDKDEVMLPDWLRENLDISKEDMQALARMNDIGVSFNTIAKYIENYM